MRRTCGQHKLPVRSYNMSTLLKILIRTTRTLLHGIGLAPDPNFLDLFIESRQYPLVYNPDEDPEVINFIQTNDPENPINLDTSDDEMSDSENKALEEEESNTEWEEEGPATSEEVCVEPEKIILRLPALNTVRKQNAAAAAAKRKLSRKQKRFSAVDKVCIQARTRFEGH